MKKEELLSALVRISDTLKEESHDPDADKKPLILAYTSIEALIHSIHRYCYKDDEPMREFARFLLEFADYENMKMSVHKEEEKKFLDLMLRSGIDLSAE